MEITIKSLEAYLHHRYHDWANEQGLFMKIVEEVGEVAEVLNKRARRKASEDGESDEVLREELGVELWDIIHYIVAIAAINDIDLTSIILKKDKVASRKYGHDIDLETFLLQERGGE